MNKNPLGNPNKHAQNQKLDRKTAKGVIIRLGRYVFAHWPLFLLALLFTLLSNQLSLLGPRYSGDAIDHIAVKGDINCQALRRGRSRQAFSIRYPTRLGS